MAYAKAFDIETNEEMSHMELANTVARYAAFSTM